MGCKVGFSGIQHEVECWDQLNTPPHSPSKHMGESFMDMKSAKVLSRASVWVGRVKQTIKCDMDA